MRLSFFSESNNECRSDFPFSINSCTCSPRICSSRRRFGSAWMSLINMSSWSSFRLVRFLRSIEPSAAEKGESLGHSLDVFTANDPQAEFFHKFVQFLSSAELHPDATFLQLYVSLDDASFCVI